MVAVHDAEMADETLVEDLFDELALVTAALAQSPNGGSRARWDVGLGHRPRVAKL